MADASLQNLDGATSAAVAEIRDKSRLHLHTGINASKEGALPYLLSNHTPCQLIVFDIGVNKTKSKPPMSEERLKNPAPPLCAHVYVCLLGLVPLISARAPGI